MITDDFNIYDEVSDEAMRDYTDERRSLAADEYDPVYEEDYYNMKAEVREHLYWIDDLAETELALQAERDARDEALS